MKWHRLGAVNPRNRRFHTMQPVVFQDITRSYVKPILTDQGARLYGVFDTGGNELARFGTQDEAFYTAEQHELKPVLLN